MGMSWPIHRFVASRITLLVCSLLACVIAGCAGGDDPLGSQPHPRFSVSARADAIAATAAGEIAVVVDGAITHRTAPMGSIHDLLLFPSGHQLAALTEDGLRVWTRAPDGWRETGHADSRARRMALVGPALVTFEPDGWQQPANPGWSPAWRGLPEPVSWVEGSRPRALLRDGTGWQQLVVDAGPQLEPLAWPSDASARMAPDAFAWQTGDGVLVTWRGRRLELDHAGEVRQLVRGGEALLLVLCRADGDASCDAVTLARDDANAVAVVAVAPLSLAAAPDRLGRFAGYAGGFWLVDEDGLSAPFGRHADLRPPLALR